MSRCGLTFVRQILLGVVLPSLVIFCLIEWARLQPALPTPTMEQDSHAFRRSYAPMRLLTDFNFEFARQGKIVFSAHGDHLAMEKKRIGFFRFGLFSEALIYNGRFTIHQHTKAKAIRQSDAPARRDSATGGHEVRHPAIDMNFLAEISVLPVQKVISMTVQPVVLEFMNDDRIFFQVKADTASIDPKKTKKVILFRGRVHAATAQRTLETERLYFDAERGICIVDTGFILTASKDRQEGTHLTLDCFSDPLTPCTELERSHRQ